LITVPRSIDLPTKIIDELYLQLVDVSVSYWILDFLFLRLQVENINGMVSTSIILNTETPRELVLSLFTVPTSVYLCLLML